MHSRRSRLGDGPFASNTRGTRARRTPVLLSPAGAILILLASGCGADVGGPNPSDTRPTLGSTAVTDTTDTDATEESIEPADVDEQAIQLTFTAAPAFCCDPLAIEFTADWRESPFVGRATYDWDFGDGRTASGKSVSHTYPWYADYLVVLSAGLPDGDTVTVRQTLSLTLDGTGGTRVNVIPETSAEPVADAGPDKSVASGDLVVLDGSGSTSSTGNVLEYHWEQTAGVPANLSATDRPVVRFVAPDTNGATSTLSFELTIVDGDLADSDGIRVTVTPASSGADTNSPPIVLDRSASVAVNVPTTLTLGGTDADGDDLSFSVVSGPTYGALGDVDSSSESSARVLYTPPPAFSGTDTFTFKAADGIAQSNIAIFTVLVTHSVSAPTALDMSYSCLVNRTGRVMLHGEDADDDNLTFTIAAGPSNGTLGPVDVVGSDSALVLYTPQEGYHGVDTFSFTVSDGVSTSNVATVTLTINKTLLPWIEINVPRWDALDIYTEESGAEPGMTVLDYGLVGLNHWSHVTDRALVTTHSGQYANLYPDLMAARPANMTIYGGVKPFNLPGTAPYDPQYYDFADPDAWAELARIAEQIALMTGTNVFVLENEEALHPFHRGQEEIDFDRLRESLTPLRDTGIEIWWNLPVILSGNEEFPDRLQRSTEFVTAIAEAVPNSVFLTAYTALYGWQDNSERVQRRQDMIDLVRLSGIQERLLVRPDGYLEWTPGSIVRCYTPAESIVGVQSLPQDMIGLYPGGVHWNLVAEEIANTLPPLVEMVEDH